MIRRRAVLSLAPWLLVSACALPHDGASVAVPAEVGSEGDSGVAPVADRAAGAGVSTKGAAVSASTDLPPASDGAATPLASVLDLPRDACAVDEDSVACPAADGPADVLAVPAFVPTLGPTNRDAWRDLILPQADEVTWETIPWRPTFAEGVLAAAEADRPLLVWAMNGHPLGCT